MAGTDSTQRVRLLYRFTFEDGSEKDFDVDLNGKSLGLILSEDRPRPDWTRLKFYQCENCPLGDDELHCPVAVNLASLVASFKDSLSFEKTKVTVVTKERTYEKDTTLQKGLSALIGIYMVTSDCPIMDRLRPMVQFHLPFATSKETIYRAVSMYLVAQFFIHRKGGAPDWELKRLTEIYKAVSYVNKGMSARLAAASNKDANVNALVILHSMGDSVPYVIENGLHEIEDLFLEYVKRLENLSSQPPQSVQS